MEKLSTGLSEIDKATKGGIASSDLTVVATPDDRIGNMVLGHYIMAGLKENQTVLLISFEKMQSFFDNFKSVGFDFQPYYENKKLLFFNFISNIRHKVGFLPDYRAIFEEIYRLSGNQMPQRIAIHQVDALLNITNPQLIHLTCEKFASGCRSKVALNTTTFAQFIKFQDSIHDGLAVGLEKSAAGYMEITQEASNSLTLQVRKMPWFDFNSDKVSIASMRVGQLLGQFGKQDVAA